MRRPCHRTSRTHPSATIDSGNFYFIEFCHRFEKTGIVVNKMDLIEREPGVSTFSVYSNFHNLKVRKEGEFKNCKLVIVVCIFSVSERWCSNDNLAPFVAITACWLNREDKDKWRITELSFCLFQHHSVVHSLSLSLSPSPCILFCQTCFILQSSAFYLFFVGSKTCHWQLFNLANASYRTRSRVHLNMAVEVNITSQIEQKIAPN